MPRRKSRLVRTVAVYGQNHLIRILYTALARTSARQKGLATSLFGVVIVSLDATFIIFVLPTIERFLIEVNLLLSR